MSDSLWPHGLYGPWNSPGQNAGVSSHSLFQGIFPTQRSNPGLLHCKQVLYQLNHKGSPRLIYNSSIFSFSFKKKLQEVTSYLRIYGFFYLPYCWKFFGGSVSKESTCNAGDPGSIPVLGRSPGERNGNPLLYSCLENPTDRGAWSATVLGVARVEQTLTATLLQIDFPENRFWDEIAVQEYFNFKGNALRITSCGRDGTGQDLAKDLD